MVKLDVIVDGERRELQLKGIKGKQIDRLMKSQLDAMGAGDDEIPERMQSYLDLQKTLASEVSGLSVDELDELEVDDRAKIYDYLTEKLKKTMGFTTLLSK